jgi:hypothetical protein
MHTTTYHRCRLWWYAINLNCQIFTYWSFFNDGTYRVVWSTVKVPDEKRHMFSTLKLKQKSSIFFRKIRHMFSKDREIPEAFFSPY